MEKLLAGFSRKCINPMMGIGISGYFKPRIADGILDDIEANVAAISKNGQTALLISLDSCEVPGNVTDMIMEEICGKLPVSKEAIFVFATHSHTTPFIGFVDEGAPKDLTDEYTEQTVKIIGEAAEEAFNDRKEAELSIGKRIIDGISFNRRYKMKDGSFETNPGVNNPNIVQVAGGVDKEITVLRLERIDGENIVIANLACHPDTIGGNKISADWPGFFRRTFEKAVDNTKCLFLNGAMGDINHINPLPKGGDMNGMIIDFDNVPRGYDHARFMGRAVAGAVLQVYDKMEKVDVDEIKYVQKVVQIPTNKATEEELIEARKICELHNAGKDDEIGAKGMMLTTVVAEAERMCRFEYEPDTLDLMLSAVAIGDVAMIGAAGEMFNAIGEAIKKTTGWKAILPCSVTNGYEGYFAMKENYDEGGYEARSSKFKSGVGEIIIEEGIKTLEQLKNE